MSSGGLHFHGSPTGKAQTGFACPTQAGSTHTGTAWVLGYRLLSPAAHILLCKLLRFPQRFGLEVNLLLSSSTQQDVPSRQIHMLDLMVLSLFRIFVCWRISSSYSPPMLCDRDSDEKRRKSFLPQCCDPGECSVPPADCNVASTSGDI